MITYYSAPRRRTVWTRFQDVGLVVALVLAVPAVFVTEYLIHRTRTVGLVEGRLTGIRGQDVTAQIVEPGFEGPWGSAAPIGEWWLVRDVLDQGWPLASREEQAPVRLELHDFDQVQIQEDVRLADGDPTRAAIERALAGAGGAVARYRLPVVSDPGAVLFDRHGWRTFLNAVGWWVGMSLLVILLAFLGRHTARLRRAGRADRKRDRRETGRCLVCDYDLRGLEFSSRCPECGTILD